MSNTNPTETEKEKLHTFYLASRALLESGVVPPMAVQRGFDETMVGFLDVDTWRPTHMSWEAAEEILHGDSRNVQRAHGLCGRLNRYDRTLSVLTGPEQPFDEWWRFYAEHDTTVLITKKEHSTGKKFDFSDLIELPEHPNRMFLRAGFSFKVRKRVELVWLRETYDRLKAAKAAAEAECPRSAADSAAVS